jgi:hypothetical protein
MGPNLRTFRLKSFLMMMTSNMSFNFKYPKNGMAERKNGTLIDVARTMLDDYKTSYLFWCEAVNTACHAINHLYLHKKLKKTSYGLLTGNKPKISYFGVFGYKCFILNKKHQTSKNLHLKLINVFFLGMGQMSMPIVSSTKPWVELK